MHNFITIILTILVANLSLAKDQEDTPQSSVLQVSEDVGKILQHGYQNNLVSKEVSKQKTDCSNCKRKKEKYKIKLKIRKFFEIIIRNQNIKIKSLKKVTGTSSYLKNYIIRQRT